MTGPALLITPMIIAPLIIAGLFVGWLLIQRLWRRVFGLPHGADVLADRCSCRACPHAGAYPKRLSGESS